MTNAQSRRNEKVSKKLHASSVVTWTSSLIRHLSFGIRHSAQDNSDSTFGYKCLAS